MSVQYEVVFLRKIAYVCAFTCLPAANELPIAWASNGKDISKALQSCQSQTHAISR